MRSSEKSSDNQEITLESVTKDFELWGQTKTSHRISHHLWGKVFLLLKYHGMGLVSNTLKISYSQIEVKRQAQNQMKLSLKSLVLWKSTLIQNRACSQSL